MTDYIRVLLEIKRYLKEKNPSLCVRDKEKVLDLLVMNDELLPDWQYILHMTHTKPITATLCVYV